MKFQILVTLIALSAEWVSLSAGAGAEDGAEDGDEAGNAAEAEEPPPVYKSYEPDETDDPYADYYCPKPKVALKYTRGEEKAILRVLTYTLTHNLPNQWKMVETEHKDLFEKNNAIPERTKNALRIHFQDCMMYRRGVVPRNLAEAYGPGSKSRPKPKRKRGKKKQKTSTKQ